MPEVIIEFVYCTCDGDRHDIISLDGKAVCENCGKEYQKGKAIMNYTYNIFDNCGNIEA